MVFTSPTMAKFYRKMEEMGKHPSKVGLWFMSKPVELKEAFGIASQTTDGGVVHAWVVQPFRFYDKGEYLIKDAVGAELPIKDAHFLFFYFMLKRAAEGGANKFCMGKKMMMENQPYAHLYDEIIRLAPEVRTKDMRGDYGKVGIFTRRRRGE
jgi:hypothetical protein